MGDWPAIYTLIGFKGGFELIAAVQIGFSRKIESLHRFIRGHSIFHEPITPTSHRNKNRR
jgi:hypothetical protein